MSSSETTPLLHQRHVTVTEPASTSGTSGATGTTPPNGAGSHTHNRWHKQVTLRRHSLAGPEVETSRLGSVASFVFLSNLITGPGMLAFPAAYQARYATREELLGALDGPPHGFLGTGCPYHSHGCIFEQGGWVTGILFTALFTGITATCSGYLIFVWRKFRDERDDIPTSAPPQLQRIASGESVKSFPETSSQAKQGESTNEPAGEADIIEYETLVRAASPDIWYILFQFFFLFAMVVMTISSICVVAREIDNLFIIFFGNAYGLQMSPSVHFVPSCRPGEECRTREAFQDTDDIHGMVISQGYIITLLITLPLSLIEIAETFQVWMYIISLICLLELIGAFAYIVFNPVERAEYVHSGVPAVNYNVGLVMEVCFWAWAISFATPMWLNQKAEGVHASPPLWWACVHRGALDILLGLTGAFAFPGLDTLNVLDELRLRPDVSAFTRICGIVFAVTSILPNVVDYAMAASRNLQGHVGVLWANILSVGLPFSLSWVFYFGAAFNNLVNATSTFLGGLVQFIVPALLFLYCIRKPAYGQVNIVGIRLTLNQWRWVTITLIVVVGLMVVLVYTLNAMVSQGVYGPEHAVKVAERKDAEDYSAYAAYDDNSAVPVSPPPPNPSAPPTPTGALLHGII